ncbi:LPS assembly lipoprotein LptE [Candidatus Profftia sp. (ex Adelges kitamiensis)]|uniref:LPS assembly lipoprotein LptE n=1 Tax=Candidatus Profftia sp. (ex Adelges kitamiensis) TaxID=2864218 RepID=UPI001CE330EF|nr:LPS assembly lipoprotein LptE [Candidatus Profftia sp. (ex Adelges kitamiensis)]
MRERTITLIVKITILGLILLITSCGFHSYNNNLLPKKFQKIMLYTTNPYSFLSRSIREQLCLHGITILECNSLLYSRKNRVSMKNTGIVNNYSTTTIPSHHFDAIPSLSIINIDDKEEIVSLFNNGKIAEYQIMLNINAQLSIHGKDIYPLTVHIYRSFFDNPFNALAKNAEKTIMRNEMFEQAAQQLVRKLFFIYTVKLYNNYKTH